MPRARAFLLFLFCLGCSFFGCSVVRSPGPYGNSARKEPLEDERPYFYQALLGPVSPEEPFLDGEMVGWYGVIVEIEPLRSGVTWIVLDHRYADDKNLRYGLTSASSIHTVSLFGGGRFETATTYPDAAKEWLPGDLLRVYGKAYRKEGEGVRVVPVYFRHWPRQEYEVAPLRPVRNEEGTIRRKAKGRGKGWPELRLDFTVLDRSSPADEKVREKLIARYPESDEAHKRRIAFTLGEIGGEESAAFLAEAAGEATDDGVRRACLEALRRARGEVGPHWNPSAPVPYWRETFANVPIRLDDEDLPVVVEPSSGPEATPTP
ncbi:MAG: hypothetical protein KatS3mg076_2376 [Candidatus Binatia bacterium]|nr:MAG: hypothetical protein KatS3mg076_2376 [Candidatus Binatia bacterium]